MTLIHKESARLKDCKINEKMVQDFIAKNPKVLGIDDSIELITKEKYQGVGYLDLLFESEDEEDPRRYEVEIQLGKTNPSHIIRTIEYWDNENKSRPKLKHIAVLIAEEITGRFYNVISLFNSVIPIIVIQMSAYKEENGNIGLVFNKVLDLSDNEEDEDNDAFVTDRTYWENKSTKKMIELMDELYVELNVNYHNVELKYNKHYIGLTQEGNTKNYFSFIPKKNFIKLRIKSKQNDDIENEFNSLGFNVYYNNRPGAKHYVVSLKSMDEFHKVKELVTRILPKE